MNYKFAQKLVNLLDDSIFRVSDAMQKSTHEDRQKLLLRRKCILAEIRLCVMEYLETFE